MNNEIVTIIGDAYFEPICTLLERLDRFNEHEKSEIRSGFFVNGFAVSICLLAVACLESYVMRVRFIRQSSRRCIDKESVAQYLPRIYQDFPYTSDLNEIYILRDIIIHNHLWELGFTWNDGGSELTKANKKSSGDKKYSKYVDVNKRKTTNLGLTVNPIKVGKGEVLKVLQTMWKILIFLEKKDRNLCYVSAAHYRYKGKMTQFGEVVGMPETCT